MKLLLFSILITLFPDASALFTSGTARFVDGEQYEYELSFKAAGIDIKIGKGSIGVSQDEYAGSKAYLSQLKGQPGKLFAKLFPLSYESRLYLSPDKKPLYFKRTFKEGKIDGYEEYFYDWDNKQMRMNTLDKVSGPKDITTDIRPWTFDYNTIYLLLRNFNGDDLKAGMGISPNILLTGDEVNATLTFIGPDEESGNLLFDVIINTCPGLYLRKGVHTHMLISSDPDHHLERLEVPVPLGKVILKRI